jgi:RNA 3'-terminal phosphate cyclase (ATP)
MHEPILVDGAQGEGGGQILRTCLALALVTGRPFRMERIRARRDKPGLMRQHLTAVRAAAEVSTAEVQGAAIGAAALTFRPGPVRAGEYRFAVGTAGSVTLVLQTVLPALMLASGPSRLVLEGGTHNPFAPPWDFLAKSFLPLLCQMGPQVTTTLERHGFYPAGGGRFTVEIAPAASFAPLVLLEAGALVARRARALVSDLPPSIATRELGELGRLLGLTREELHAETIRDHCGPGNVVMVELEHASLTEVFTGFGRKGVPAERVAHDLADEVRAYLRAEVPVGPHLADQLLLPLALGRGGRFRTVAPTTHTRTNADVVRQFLDVDLRLEHREGEAWEISIERGAA